MVTHTLHETAPSAADVGSLIDVERGLISRRIFSDEGIYRRELEQIFARCWLMLCPEQQIPRAGDFFATRMGEDPVLVVRQKDGSIRALLNSCRHRGMKVCRADMGNAKGFTCTYHGWAYDAAGRLVNLPFEDKGYHNELPKDEWGLIQVAQLDTYKGLVFATWDPTAPPLLDYLGDSRLFLDALADRRPGGHELVGGVLRWRFKGNWKFAAEQFASDNYHGPFSHASAFQALMSTATPEAAEAIARMLEFDDGFYQYASRLGHGSGYGRTRDFPTEMQLNGPPIVDYLRDVVMPEVRTGDGYLVQGHHNIFPTLAFLIGPQTVRTWLPCGPDALEVVAWVIVDREAPPEVKDAYRRFSQLTFSGSGIFEQDDGENWGEIQKVLRGAVQRRYPFNYTMGLGHERDRQDEGLPGTTAYIMNEAAARGFYRRYSELMQGVPWSEIPPLATEAGSAAVSESRR